MNNLDMWERVRAVPKEAQKIIGGGKLKGFTDINPMWRLKTLTNLFGPCGEGWYTEIVNHWVEPGTDGRIAAFVGANLFYKLPNGEWSKPVYGVGGSTLTDIEKDMPRTSDEAYKMAYTDAISVCCKALGMGADIYWDKDKTKYTTPNDSPEPPRDNLTAEQKIDLVKIAKERFGADAAKKFNEVTGNRGTKDIKESEFAVIKEALLNA